MRLLDLVARLERGEAVVAGVLSGTSADGIDVALVRFPARASGSTRDLGAPVPLAFETRPFPGELASRLRPVLDGVAVPLGELARLHRDLGSAFGRAARELARREGSSLDLVASHGQTVYHHDGLEPSGPVTLQLGDGDHVARAAGAWVASDFRQGDVAAGGEGAPLSALADPLLFARLERPAAVLNLGGIANLTLLPAGEAAPLAFDTGPCNALLDGLARRLLGRPFDPGGERALSGRADKDFVAWLGEHPFLARRPPKTTGRDTFGEAFVERALARGRERDLGDADLLASAACFIARTVQRDLARWAPDVVRLVVAGGGLHHRRLRAELGRAGHEVLSSAEVGVDPDAREALVFAILGARCVLGLSSSPPAGGGEARRGERRAVTGARPGAVLGKLSPAPPDPVA